MDVQGEAKTFSPEEISAMILTKMKDTAEVRGDFNSTCCVAAGCHAACLAMILTR